MRGQGRPRFSYFTNIDIPESFIVLLSPEKSARLFLWKEVKLSPEYNMRKLLKVDNLLPPLRHSPKTCRRRTTSIMFSRQNDARPRARTT